MINKKTKIVATIGPASQKKTTLKKMVKAGMNVVRLNFSHGTYYQFREIIKTVREVEKELGVPVAIMQDLQGPKIRVGDMPEKGILLKNGKIVILTAKNIIGTDKEIPVQYKSLYKDVNKGDRILINDGMIELQVIKVAQKKIHCKVTTGGKVFSRKGINVPTASISANPITAKDRRDLMFGLENNVDFVAMSFVKDNTNIEELRDMIRRKEGQTKIIAKVERHEAVKNLEKIIKESDGVMVARGDMGVEISPEKVPLIQKKMIHLANIHGKPVITATEMLQSMIENPRPTRAEVSDIANAVIDNTDAIMLSNETAVGKYPVEAVKIMAKVAALTEKDLQKHRHFLPNRLFTGKFPVSYATCASAAKLAAGINAKLIVAVTFSGFTAQHISKHRIFIPIIAVTQNPKVQKQLQLVWGVKKVFIKNFNLSRPESSIKKLLFKNKLVKKNDKIVIVSNASNNEKTITALIMDTDGQD